MTQKDLVINHIERYGSITSMSAIHEYSITRLADVIYKLKADGYDIETEIVAKKRFSPIEGKNVTKTYAKYSLKSENSPCFI